VACADSSVVHFARATASGFAVFVDAAASDAPGVVAGFLAAVRLDAFVIDGVRGFSVACSIWSIFVIRIALDFSPIVFRG